MWKNSWTINVELTETKMPLYRRESVKNGWIDENKQTKIIRTLQHGSAEKEKQVADWTVCSCFGRRRSKNARVHTVYTLYGLDYILTYKTKSWHCLMCYMQNEMSKGNRLLRWDWLNFILDSLCAFVLFYLPKSCFCFTFLLQFFFKLKFHTKF